MSLPKLGYTVLGLPSYFHGLTFQDTKVPITKVEGIKAKIATAPQSGVLLVSGCSAPIINQLLETRKVVGLDFVEYFNSKFLKESDPIELPNASVVLIYNIGNEPVNNAQYSAKILNSIMSTYKSRTTLVVLETPLTLNNFATQYGVTIKNTLTIGLQDEPLWM